ncbi:MAG: rhodanese-like domain-containing protein [Bacteroidota bacterium]
MNKNSEKDYSVISNKLPIGGLIFAIIIILGVVFVKEPSKKFSITTENMLTELQTYEDAVGPEKIMDILYNDDNLYRFIDLRSSHDFIKGHMENAINIPIHKILDDEYEKILNQDEYINILYYSDHCGACGPWMILKQLGYKNNKILLGGYDYVNNFILKEYTPMTGNFKNEKAKYDFAKIVSETAGAGSGTSSSKSSKKAPIKKKKKKAGADGGC